MRASASGTVVRTIAGSSSAMTPRPGPRVKAAPVPLGISSAQRNSGTRTSSAGRSERYFRERGPGGAGRLGARRGPDLRHRRLGGNEVAAETELLGGRAQRETHDLREMEARHVEVVFD